MPWDPAPIPCAAWVSALSLGTPVAGAGAAEPRKAPPVGPRPPCGGCLEPPPADSLPDASPLLPSSLPRRRHSIKKWKRDGPRHGLQPGGSSTQQGGEGAPSVSRPSALLPAPPAASGPRWGVHPQSTPRGQPGHEGAPVSEASPAALRPKAQGGGRRGRVGHSEVRGHAFGCFVSLRNWIWGKTRLAGLLQGVSPSLLEEKQTVAASGDRSDARSR